MYRTLFKKVISRFDAEKAHECTIRMLAALSRCEVADRVLATFYSNRRRFPKAKFGEDVFDRPIPSPIGLGAGMDKNADAIRAFDALGFGFIEIGTVTPRPQPGNQKPRLWRHPSIDGLRNQMGFNNEGAHVIAGKLKQLRSDVRGRQIVVGASIGKNRTTELEHAVDDYRAAASELARWVDYIAINISSPNTPGLQTLQYADSIKEIAGVVIHAAKKSAGREVPVFVKLSPDLSEEAYKTICNAVNSSDLRGVIIANTTTQHSLGEGGLSGRPLTQRAANCVSEVRKLLRSGKKIIGVGGIWNQNDINRMMDSGADLVQVYSGYVYNGPNWLRRLNRTAAGAKINI